MWWLLLLLIPLSWAALVLPSWRRPSLGLVEGKLRRCPDSPNCVCSEGATGEHAIDPFSYATKPSHAAAWSDLKVVLQSSEGARIITQNDEYMHVEFTTPLMRYVDDVEFRKTPEAIHVRSASRVGRSDLGANRKRMERLRQAYQPTISMDQQS